ncbi:DUF2057 family protein [Vibrio maritimus]|uniref:DUF2057 family protein n=1 Tax=Vibrio maritimus TaxID=990268 RepID=UPI003736B11A
MLRKTVVVMSLLLGACSSLDSESDFSQSVESVSHKGDKITVVGKKYSPEIDSSNGGDILKSNALVVLQASRSPEEKSVTGYMNMEVSYFKSYTEFEKASYQGKLFDLTELKPSTSVCTEHCTATQYISFPIDQSVLNSVNGGNFKFDLVTNSDYKVTFFIANGYIKSLSDELANQRGQTNAVATTAAIAAAPVIATSVGEPDIESGAKSVQMIQYWYDKAPAAEREEFVDWAYQYRKTGSDVATFKSQPAQMMQYWYNEASLEERQKALSWLISR